MLAYVELIQRKEKEIGCDVLTHQKWSGASYIDRVLAGAFALSFPLRSKLTECGCSGFGWIVGYGCEWGRVDGGFVPLDARGMVGTRCTVTRVRVRQRSRLVECSLETSVRGS